MKKWALDILGGSSFTARELPRVGIKGGIVGPKALAYLLAQIPTCELPVKPVGKSGQPCYWHWQDADETTIVLLDSKCFPLQRFKVTDQFREQLSGRYRRTSTQAYGHSAQASGPGYPRAGTSYITSYPIVRALESEPGPRPIDNAGIRTGEIVAHRAWLYMGRGYLRSMYKSGTVWKPGEVMTGDPEDMRYFISHLGHAVSGVHAFKERGYLMHYMMLYLQQRERQLQTMGLYPSGEPGEDSAKVISGTVELWGTVIEHEFGYRASHAAITSFAPQTQFDVRELCERYGVPHG